jgi:hypothetical protein
MICALRQLGLSIRISKIWKKKLSVDEKDKFGVVGKNKLSVEGNNKLGAEGKNKFSVGGKNKFRGECEEKKGFVLMT